ncbi:MAG: hypothetical protein ACI9EF_001604 [Pseudohongiellaceae bacterium]|jgi:hypothetical protein
MSPLIPAGLSVPGGLAGDGCRRRLLAGLRSQPALLWVRAVLVVLCLASASAAAPDIVVGLEPEPAEVGLVMSVTVTISGNESIDCDLLEVPTVDGGRLRFAGGPSTRNMYSTLNGRRSTSITTTWEFELVPQREGLLVIPPFRFNCRGTQVESQTRVVTVQPTSLREGLVSIEVKPATYDLWLGQVVDVEVSFSVLEAAYDNGLRNGLEITLPWVTESPALHFIEPVAPNCNLFMATVQPGGEEIPTCVRRDFSSGESTILQTQTIPMLAIEAGEVSLGDARFDFRLVVERQRKRNGFSLFGGLDSVPTRVVVATASEPGPTLTIREPPVATRPPSYTNAVGRFRLDARAEPRELVVGESCKLRLGLVVANGGSGHLGMVEWPEFASLSEDFRLFGKEDLRTEHVRELVLDLAPKNDRVEAIPQLSFSFFDPVTERYETLTVGPFELDVAPGGTDGLTELNTPEELLNDLETIRERLRAPGAAFAPPWVWPACAGLVLAFTEWRYGRSRWRQDNPALVARRGARRALAAELAGAADSASAAAAFSRYLSANLGGPAGGMTLEEALLVVSDPSMAERLSKTMSGWEAAYFSGAALPVDQLRSEARQLADGLERLK